MFAATAGQELMGSAHAIVKKARERLEVVEKLLETDADDDEDEDDADGGKKGKGEGDEDGKDKKKKEGEAEEEEDGAAKGGRVALLMGLYITEEMRGRGGGRMALAYLIERAWGAGVEAVEAFVRSDGVGHAMFRLLKEAGFVPAKGGGGGGLTAEQAEAMAATRVVVRGVEHVRLRLEHSPVAVEVSDR